MSPIIVILIIICLAMIPGFTSFFVGRHHSRQGTAPTESHRLAKRAGRLMSIPVYILMFGFILFLVLE